MKWRVIVRSSLKSGEGDSSLRQKIDKHFDKCKLRKSTRTTSTWEGDAIEATEAAEQFAEVFKLLSDPTQIPGLRARLDHLWIYVDRAKIPKPKPNSSPASNAVPVVYK